MPPPVREYLFSLEQIGIKLGLHQIRALVNLLERPDLAYPSVIVAGTNGKGSVTAMVERGLRAAGYCTGRYTSPHLLDLEERFVVDGQPVAPATLEGAAERIRAAAGHLPAPPSFFEATTAMALDLFREAPVDVAVLEVGLGGRLDATNVVTPIAAAITAIDFDHEQYLGHTIDAIAREKAGVIKAGSAVVLSRNPDVVQSIVSGTCAAAGASYTYAPDGVETSVELVDGRTRLSLATPRHRYGAIDLALRGRHQIDNAVTAARLLEAIGDSGRFAIEPDHVRTALATAEWPARLELRESPSGRVLIDGAHNPSGARALAGYISEVYRRRLPIVAGVMRDKAIADILAALGSVASYFLFTAADSPRAASPDELADVAHRVAPEIPVRTFARPIEALEAAHPLGDPAVVAGSLYLCGEIRREIS